jgi:acetyl-CoA carboxylase carboxyl transferase subunit beta
MISFNRSSIPVKIKEQETIQSSDWIKCPSCKTITYHKQLAENLQICPKCNFYFKMSASQRIELLLDEGSFLEIDQNLSSHDILGFEDTKLYKKRITDAEAKTNMKEAILTGSGKVEGYPLAIGIMEFEFIGGSMGVVVGEKILRLTEMATTKNLPLLIIVSSGGARMQEGMFSLMQMARTSGAIGRLQKKNGLYITLLTNPTTGGVSASFAFLGDIILAEPGATIGFAGARVIEQTTRQKLPPKFQTTEFLMDHGQLDKIVERKHIRRLISRILSFYYRGRESL